MNDWKSIINGATLILQRPTWPFLLNCVKNDIPAENFDDYFPPPPSLLPITCFSPSYSAGQSLGRFQLNCPCWVLHLVCLISRSLSLGLWQNVILFFTPDVISNLIEVHFCPPVLWIKMGSFYGRRCAAPWLSTLSFRLSLPWRWIVRCLCELHKLTCESCGAGEGEAADSPFRRRLGRVNYPSGRSGGAAGCFLRRHQTLCDEDGAHMGMLGRVYDS